MSRPQYRSEKMLKDARDDVRSDGLLRLSQIVPDLVPISKSAWWKGVKEGRYPQQVRISKRAVGWRRRDIVELLKSLSTKESQA